ncbi:hypothetical protein AO498_03975 [Algoriphagus sanaruensis]|uniref:Uncharacterized protein n=1 Tax=Algoriphagus sanaruensis TaxID=1727163 RepID=A0A142EK94_9BACT|nr:hypothetical protein AO498_03975 [Algoriphagus sanaruensis]
MSNELRIRITHFLLLINLFGCNLLNTEKTIIDDGEGIRFTFDDGLNDDPRFRLPKDENGFY